MNTYQKILDYIAEGEMAKADELFHTMFVDKACDLYEAMEQSDPDDLDDVDSIGGDAADSLIADVETRQPSTSMEESDEGAKKGESKKNTAHLIPAPKPVNTQADGVNNLTPFPKVN